MCVLIKTSAIFHLACQRYAVLQGQESSQADNSSQAIFSMAFVPDDIHWFWFIVVLCSLSLTTALVATYSGVVDRLRIGEKSERYKR